MNPGQRSTAHRIRRQKELKARLRVLMESRDEQNGEQLAEWSKEVEDVRRELREMR